jgi:hypothetical protein
MIDSFSFIDLGFFVAIAIFFFAMTYATISSIVSHRKKSVELSNALFEIKALRSKLAEELFTKDQAEVEKTEGFVRFVYQSREKAFEYIEDVQKDLEDLKIFFNQVGSAPQKVEDAEKLYNLINKILSHLPEDS